jgi:hypothetical protein
VGDRRSWRSYLRRVLTEIYGVPPEIATTAGIVLWGLAFMAVIPLAAGIGLQQGIS